jgi:hypothetical protein
MQEVFYTTGSTKDQITNLQSPLHPRLNHRPAGQHDDKEKLVHRPLDRVRKRHQRERHRLRPKLLGLQCPDLDAVEGRHELMPEVPSRNRIVKRIENGRTDLDIGVAALEHGFDIAL